MSSPFHYFLRIAYDGTAYHGWQRQANASPTIQQTIEELLSKVHDRDVSINGCSRTDAGVHATQFCAYFRHDQPLPGNYLFFVNHELPPDIAILEVIPVHKGAHACADATSRTYDYFFHDREDVWLARTSGRVDLSEFKVDRVAELLPELLLHSDYRAFCKTPDRHHSTIAQIRQATLYRNANGDRFRLRFVADRFLRGMIRILANDLIAVGTGKLAADAVTSMFVGGEHIGQHRLAPAAGLYLTGVQYSYIEREPELPLSGVDEWIEL